jgi:hypothetical protein
MDRDIRLLTPLNAQTLTAGNLTTTKPLSNAFILIMKSFSVEDKERPPWLLLNHQGNNQPRQGNNQPLQDHSR